MGLQPDNILTKTGVSFNLWQLSMATVSVKDEYAEILTALGDLQSEANLALQRYTIERITAKIAELQQKDEKFKAKYGTDYLSFSQRSARDEAFVSQIETRIEKLWEIDLANWEFCYKGIEDWTQKLKSISLM